MKCIYLIPLMILSLSCISKEGNRANSAAQDTIKKDSVATQIGQYVVKVFKDSKGNLWLGTIEKGVAKYDGSNLKYLTQKDGLPSDRVVDITEDHEGNLWFGTGRGLSKYDGTTFTNFTKNEGLCNNMISRLLIDSKGTFWIGTWGGICQYDGSRFVDVDISYPTVDGPINPDTKDWITEIIEDGQGNIWIAKDGYGVTKYDGQSFQHFTKNEGLHSNNVTKIAEDKDGSMWFGTRVAEKDNPDPNNRFGPGGINKLVDGTFLSFPEIRSFNHSDVYGLYRDRSGQIWIGTIKDGVYKFDGSGFMHYDVPISIVSMLQDEMGNIWLGGAGGLYRINGAGEVQNITTSGPWK